MNAIEEYWQAIESGQITVSAKVRKAYQKIYRDLSRTDWEWMYSQAKADHAIKFITHFCRQSKGKDGGKPLQLLLWQKALLSALFGFVDLDGNRKYRELFLVVARKCGKTTLASGIGLYLLYADGEHGPQIVSAATTREQAKLSWDEARKMIKKSPALSSRSRCLVGEILTDFNDGQFKPLASDSNTLDGLNPSGAIMDEVAAWQNGKALYDVIVDGETARERPLNIMITTAGTVREDIFDLLYEQAERVLSGYTDPDGYHDERFLPIIYELDSRAEWTDEACWMKANPSLDAVKDRASLRYKVNRAEANPMMVKNLLCKDFNIRETSDQAWLSFEDIDNRDTFDLDKDGQKLIYHHGDCDTELPYPRYGIAGADLSSTTDLTAGSVIFTVPGAEDTLFVMPMFWLPADLLDRRTHEDKIPYDIWQKRGLLRVSAGNKINYSDVTEWFASIQNDLDIYIPWVGYDAWSARYWSDEMAGIFGTGAMRPVRQGKPTLSEPMKRLANDLIAKKVVYGNNPILKWCLANTSYEEDRNGNIQPRKTSSPTKRIDGLAALLDAYVVFNDNRADYLNMI